MTYYVMVDGVVGSEGDPPFTVINHHAPPRKGKSI